MREQRIIKGNARGLSCAPGRPNCAIPDRISVGLVFGAVAALLGVVWTLNLPAKAADWKRGSVGAGALAAALPSGTSQSSNLTALLDGLQRKYSRMQGIAADFVQTYVGADGRVLKESGRVLLKRPRKARWDYAVPERKIFVADGKNIFFYVYGEREATRTPIKGSVDPQIPFLFLLSSINISKEFSKIEIASEQSPVLAGDVMLHLVPKRAPEEFKSLYAEVSPQSMEVRRLIVGQRNGSTMDFLLTNVRENSVAADSEFSFSPPPGVVVRRAE